jgi:hypothetical protein
MISYLMHLVFDASTKIPNGVLAGNFFDLGNFDECYGITHGQIYGKYCLGTLPVESVPQKYSKIFTRNMTQQVQFHQQFSCVFLTSFL